MPDLTRRDVFRNGAYLTAGLAAGAIVTPRLAAASPLPQPSSHPCAPAPSPSPGPVAGATINPASYGSTDWLAAAQRFDGYVGLPLAESAQKRYLREGNWWPRVPRSVTELPGARFLVSVKPSRTLSTAEQDRLRAFLRMLLAAGVNFKAILWQECDDGHHFTAATWARYWAHYAPVILAEGVTLIYNPGVNPVSGARAAGSFFPASPLPGEVWADFYASSHARGARLDGLLAAAAARGLPWGLAEYGDTALPEPVTHTEWDQYVSSLCTTITGWRKAGHAFAGALYFASAAATQYNVVGGAGDFKVTGIRQVSAVAGA